MLLSVGLRQNLYLLFSQMSVATAVLGVVGLALIIIEFFQPAHKIPTYCGTALVLCAIAVRILCGGTFVMLFFMIFFCVLILFAAHLIMLVTQKKAWLATSLAIRLKREVDESQKSGYAYLLGLSGIASTDISPSGHVNLEGTDFIVSSDEFIEKGSLVEVVHVVGDVIKVVPADSDN